MKFIINNLIICQFFKSRLGISGIEYALGLALIASVLITSYNDTGVVFLDFLKCVAVGGGTDSLGNPIPCIQH